VQVVKGGTFDVTARFPKPADKTPIRFKLGDTEVTEIVPSEATQFVFSEVKLAEGPGRLEVEIGADKIGATYVEVKRR
jgi:hypothetical protein